MKKLVFTLLSMLFTLYSGSLFAHALWIETSATGKVGKPQTVKVYYGEFVENERDSVAKWYSDVKDFKLWVIGPDQQKVQLTMVAGTNSFEGTFTPEKEGTYAFEVSHEAKELGGTTKYHFLANAHVTVGKTAVLAKQTNALHLSAEPGTQVKVNGTVKLRASLNGVPAKEKTISVFSPMGWSREIKTDQNGLAEFAPLWPGRYVVEISDMDKIAGKHYDKDFTGTWKGATLSFEIK